MARRIDAVTSADYDSNFLATYAPAIVHVDTANAIVTEAIAVALASLHAPAPRRYVGVPAT